MKNVYVTFTDEEHAELVKAKGKTNWHDFILNRAKRSGKP